LKSPAHRTGFERITLPTGSGSSSNCAGERGEFGLHPTWRGPIDLMRGVGFREVIEVEGVPDPAWVDWEWVDWEKDIYAAKLRRCLIGLK
jgi:hypothetical protein